jgi:glycosyltransferase involved in cell wall biosynthesis
MLAWEFPPRIVGGLAMHVYELSTAMVRRGVDVTVITYNDQSVAENEVMEGVKVVRVNAYDVHSRDIVSWALQLNVAMLEKAVQTINKEGTFDLVHSHDWMVAHTGRALKHAYHIPLIATIHATEHGRNDGIHNDIQQQIADIEWWLTYEAWKVICCSRYMVDEVYRVFNLPGDKVVHIDNGVRPERFKNRPVPDNFKSRFALPHERIIYYVGRLVREKGVQVLIEAASKILAGCPDAKFVIAGTGPFEVFLRNQARDMGLGDKIMFTGYLSDEDRDLLYQIADAAVFPSLYEPFGIVALEAMASGTPLVVSDSGGLAEIVNHNEDGLYAITGSANSVADQILRILNDKELAGRLSANGERKVKDYYDWHVIAGKTMGVYESVIQASRSQPWEKPAQVQNREKRFFSYGRN